jgi:N-acetylmuramoyl-L-alanine amidase
VLSKTRVIAVDPGHGGAETGAVHLGPNRQPDLIEKNVNLQIALYLADQLSAAGYQPVLTRTTDSGVDRPARDLNGDGVIDNDDDLQARVDIANNAGADLLLSVHNNGAANPTVRGTSTWYARSHPLGERAQVLAELVQKELLAGLRRAGYDDPIDGGANDDPPLQKPFGHLFLVGPKTPRVARVSRMPGVVGESLYVTSTTESALLKKPSIQQAIAAAYVRAVDDYFTRFPDQ